MADEKKINQQAVNELIEVCERQVKHYESQGKKWGFRDIGNKYPLYRPMKKALENFNK